MNTDFIIKILIVDDILSNIISLKAVLDSEEVKLFSAMSGNEALKILLEEEIDIVLLDVQMPEMNGFEVAEIMRSNKRTMNIPIIFITAISKEEKYIFKGYELGAFDYIFKPISNTILKSKMEVFIKLNVQNKIIEKNARELEEKSLILENKIRELEIAEEKLKSLASMDGLTGIYNRRTFDTEFNNEWYRGLRNNKKISLIMIDVDDFKSYNDNYGHLNGDECLKSVAHTIRDSIERPYDIVCRYGGEEFVVLLVNTDVKGAEYIANKIKENIYNLNIKHEHTAAKRVTISLGVASMMPVVNYERENFIKLADKALYEAKRKGKNRVTINKSEK